MTNYQSKRLAIGSMRDRIVIETEQTTLDSDTGQPIRAWSTFYSSVPAVYTPTRSGESFRGGQVEAGINAVFTMRYQKDIAPTMRIRFDGIIYNIVFVMPVTGAKRYLDIYCRAVNNDGI